MNPVLLSTTSFQAFRLPSSVNYVTITFSRPLFSSLGRVASIKYFYDGNLYNVDQEWDGGKKIRITGLLDNNSSPAPWSKEVIDKALFLIPTFSDQNYQPIFIESINMTPEQSNP